MPALVDQLNKLEADKKKGIIDQQTYNYMKNQYFASDKKYNTELDSNYNSYKNTDPLKTDTSKSILSEYQAKGYNAMNNEIAGGASNNGGNVDSFAAANALRQQLDFTNQGVDKAIAANETHQDRLMNYLNMMKNNTEGYYSKVDSMQKQNLQYQLDIGNRINSIASQMGAGEEAAKERANQQYMLQQQKKAELEKMAKQYQYESSLSKYSTSGGGSGGSSSPKTSNTGINLYTYGYKEDGKATFTDSNGKKKLVEIGTSPYTGAKNADIKYGTFTNGYQPNNIKGNKLSAVDGTSINLNGREQKVWTTNGRFYYWDGTKNDYFELTQEELDAVRGNSVSNSSTKSGYPNISMKNSTKSLNPNGMLTSTIR